MSVPPAEIHLHRDVVVGAAKASIPQRVTHHSPTGFEWGYGGSGPADLALNILDRFVPPGSDGQATVRCHDGHVVSGTAWALHQDFKREVIARLPHSGAILSADFVRTWLAQHGALTADERGRLRTVRDRVSPDEG